MNGWKTDFDASKLFTLPDALKAKIRRNAGKRADRAGELIDRTPARLEPESPRSGLSILGMRAGDSKPN